MKASDFNIKQDFALLLVGSPKTGKSVLASQFPQPYFIDFDGNMGGVVRTCKEQKLSLDFEWDSVNVDSKSIAVPRADRFARAMKLAEDAFNNPKYQTIVFDSLSSMSQVLLDKIRMEQKRGMGEELLGANYTQRFIDPVLQIQDWGALKGLLYNILSTLRTVPKKLIITAHTQIEQEELTKDVREVVSLPGSTRDIIGGFFTDVWMMEIDTKTTSSGLQYSRTVRTLPQLTRQKTLGLGSTMGLKPTQSVEEVIKLIQAI